MDQVTNVSKLIIWEILKVVSKEISMMVAQNQAKTHMNVFRSSTTRLA
jgi:hypothetical protein